MVIGKYTPTIRRIFFVVGVDGGGYAGGTFHGGICHGGREFPRRGCRIFLHFLKSNEKIDVKEFLQLKVRSSIKN